MWQGGILDRYLNTGGKKANQFTSLFSTSRPVTRIYKWL
jgi:hypothetical protein